MRLDRQVLLYCCLRASVGSTSYSPRQPSGTWRRNVTALDAMQICNFALNLYLAARSATKCDAAVTGRDYLFRGCDAGALTICFELSLYMDM